MIRFIHRLFLCWAARLPMDNYKPPELILRMTPVHELFGLTKADYQELEDDDALRRILGGSI